MKNEEIIRNIFEKTESILNPVWVNYTNPQMSHILYYLSLTAGYLKSKEEAEVFRENWEKIKDKIKDGSNPNDFLNQSNMINSHLEQALREESVHNPIDSRNRGVARFYESEFPELYKDAKQEYEGFQKGQDEMVKVMQKHHDEVFSSQEVWEAAFKRGDPMALVD